MPIKAVCPRCERKHLLDDRFDGKKIRCKGCDKSFLVGEPADDEDEKPKKKKKKKKPQGSPVLLFALLGGGVLLLLLCVGGGVGIYFATRSPNTPATPIVKNNNPPPEKAKDMSLFEKAQPGPHGAILDEAVASVGRVVNAIAGIGSDAAVPGAATAIRAETDKINQLTNRLTVGGAPSQADLQRMRNFQRENEPNAKRLAAEVQRLNVNKVLTPAGANELRQATSSYVSAAKSFDAVLDGMVR